MVFLNFVTLVSQKIEYCMTEYVLKNMHAWDAF